MNVEDPHRNQPVLVHGQPLDSAKAAVILVHGRGASAADILSLTEELDHPQNLHIWLPRRPDILGTRTPS